MLEDALMAYEGAALLVSHDRYFISRVANRIVELRDGEILDTSRPALFMTTDLSSHHSAARSQHCSMPSTEGESRGTRNCRDYITMHTQLFDNVN